MSDMVENLREFLNSDEGKISTQNYINKIIFEDKLKENNILRIKKMFSDQKSFNSLVIKIINKHDDKWVKRCHKQGIESHPFELLYSLFNLAENEGVESDPIDGFTENFPSQIYTYNDWQFAITHGQGSVCSVYYKEKIKYRD